MQPPWRRTKNLSCPRGGSPGEACARHTDRGVVPGRDAGWPEEQAHLSLGQEGLTTQFMRQNWLSNRIFKSFDYIVDHCCYAWNTLLDQPWKIMSIARRDWASVGYSM